MDRGDEDARAGSNSGTEMKDRKLRNKRAQRETLALELTAAVAEAKRSGKGRWLIGAYALLVAWGVAYLLLFFMDRLPI